MAKLNIDLSEAAKSAIFVRSVQAKKTLKEYVLEKLGVLNIEIKANEKNKNGR